MPLGLSGLAFSTTVFFSKYQIWFLAIGFVALGVAHHTARKAGGLVGPTQRKLLWASTVLTALSAVYYLYSNYFFLINERISG